MEREFFGTRIRARRIELGMTQEELGRRIGASGGNVSQYEAGHKKGIRYEKAESFARALSSPDRVITASWIISGKDPIKMEVTPEEAAHIMNMRILDEQARALVEMTASRLKAAKLDIPA